MSTVALSAPQWTPTRPKLPVSAPLSSVPFGRLSSHISLATDFQDGTSNLEAERRIDDVSTFIAQNKPLLLQQGWLSPTEAFANPVHQKPRVQSIEDVSDINYQGLTLQRLGGSRPNQDVIIHVCDPGVGVRQIHDRSILVTQNSGTYVGPNNGSLGVVATALKARGEGYKLIPIDFNKVQAFERLRTGDPHYEVPHTFHARDVFAVVGSAIANGIEPEKFQDDRLVGRIPVYGSAFSQHIAPLPTQVGEKRAFVGIRDKTSGNVKTDLLVSPPQRNALIAQQAAYRLYWQGGDQSWQQAVVPFKGFFSEVPQQQPLAYSGSSKGVYPNTYFVELAKNLGNISESLQLPLAQAKNFVIERVQ